MPILLLMFVVIPLIEIALFIKIGGIIGLWPTLAIVVATAIAGSMLLRRQGGRALADVQRAFVEFRDPTAPLAHGALLLLAGALLVSPFTMYRYDASYAIQVYAAHPTRFRLIKPVDATDPAVAETIADWAATKGTVAIRLPDDEVARELLRRTGPLAVSSANRSGRPAATNAAEAEYQLGEHVDVVLDGGPRSGSAASRPLGSTAIGVSRLSRKSLLVTEAFVPPSKEPAEKVRTCRETVPPGRLTVPPPYWPFGMTPSNPLYSSGWSSVCIARRLSEGSRLGPFGTAQDSITPSSSSRKS